MNVKKNSPELYMHFLDLILRLGRRASSAVDGRPSVDQSPDCATGITAHLKNGGVPENAGPDASICSVGASNARDRDS
jgi:hypothetical protein